MSEDAPEVEPSKKSLPKAILGKALQIVLALKDLAIIVLTILRLVRKG